VEYGLMMEPQMGMTYAELAGAAKWAEARGLAAFARADHVYSSKGSPHVTEAFTSLAAIALETQAIELCVLVTPISFRHPAIIAKSAATVDEISGGRLRLGVGTGWMELEHEAFGMELWPMKERFARLEETLGYLRAAFGDGATGFAGQYYSLDKIDVRPKPTGDLPIVVGGSGPERTPYLAGTYGDEFNIGIRDPATLADRIGKVRAAADKAGRDPDAIKFSVAGPVLTGADEASYQRRLAATAAARDRTPDEHERAWRAAGIPVGTAAAVRRVLDAIANVGVERFYMQHFAAPDLEEFVEVFDSLGA
jgi:alkanesulfonate monooxygenase SsuD/methylene tetrahydromethanopterin reductase-like flavin-dependent oxidoreductase (luciferase family)